MYNEEIAVYYRHMEELQSIVNDAINLMDKVEDGRIQLDGTEYYEKLMKFAENAVYEAKSAKEIIEW